MKVKSLYTVFSVFLFTICMQNSTYAQCTACTYVVSSNSTTNYNLNNGETLCINTGVSFGGNINLNGGTLCNNGNITGAGNINFNSGKIYNNGFLRQSNSFSFGGEIYNYGNLSVNSHLNINNGGSLHNAANATINVSGSINNNNIFYNHGSVTVGGNYSANSNSVNENHGSITLTAGNLYVNSHVLNEGTMDVKGNLHVNGGGSLTNGVNDRITVGGNYENNSTTNNSGYIEVGGNFTNNGGATFADNLSMIVMGNFMNNGTITGDVTGCNVFSVFGSSIVQNGGASINSVDFCGNGVPGNFSTNYGSLNNVTFCSCDNSGVSPLPIVLSAFTAVCNNGKVNLEWITATEINNAYFTISRSADAQNWETIRVVSGAGNSNAEIVYTLEDERSLDGVSYYRLQQTDYDGTTEYFEPIGVSCSGNGAETKMLVYPNPAEEQFTVSIRSEQPDWGTVELWDMTGRKLLSESRSLSVGANTLTFDRNNLSTGTYLIRFVFRGEVKDSQKLVLR